MALPFYIIHGWVLERSGGNLWISKIATMTGGKKGKRDKKENNNSFFLLSYLLFRFGGVFATPLFFLYKMRLFTIQLTFSYLLGTTALSNDDQDRDPLADLKSCNVGDIVVSGFLRSMPLITGSANPRGGWFRPAK